MKDKSDKNPLSGDENAFVGAVLVGGRQGAKGRLVEPMWRYDMVKDVQLNSPLSAFVRVFLRGGEKNYQLTKPKVD